MLTKIGSKTYQTEDGFPAVPLWIDRPDRNGSRFIHWHGKNYDVGYDNLTISFVTDTFRHSGVLTLDYWDWCGETGNEPNAVFQKVGRDRLVQLREDTNALLRREWQRMGESPWRGPHPEEDRMLNIILPVVVHHDWKSLGF